MIFFWPKVYGPLGKTPYIYPRYQVWGVTDLNFDLAYYPPPLLGGGGNPMGTSKSQNQGP